MSNVLPPAFVVGPIVPTSLLSLAVPPSSRRRRFMLRSVAATLIMAIVVAPSEWLLVGRGGAVSFANALLSHFPSPTLRRSGRSRTSAEIVRVSKETQMAIRLSPMAPLHIAGDNDSAMASASTPQQPSLSSTPQQPVTPLPRTCRARDLVISLVRDSGCFDTLEGARLFGEACDPDVVWDDRFLPEPIKGRGAVVEHLERMSLRHSRRRIRIDRVSDGDEACGYCWTWTSGGLEGLRGTTFVQLNKATDKIKFVQEIPEPLFKPGDLTKDLLQALTRGAELKMPQPFTVRTPTAASDVARYLFVDLQGAGDESSLKELTRLLDPRIQYRDFNYDEMMVGPHQVETFVRDFTFPGIEFRPTRFDDGIDSTCFTWEVVLQGVDSDQTIKGISFYELDPATRKISYIRDVPESSLKPPVLGNLARFLRPGLGVFVPVPIGSRPGGM